MNPVLVADPAGNNPLPQLHANGSPVDPKEFVEPGTGLAVTVGFIALGFGILIGGICSYGILWLVLLLAPITYLIHRKKAIAALKGSAVEVSQNQFPEIDQCVLTIASRLGMSTAPKVYILESNTINAGAIKLAGKKVIMLHDDIVDACLRSGDARTLTFIIGHEMAHHALGHTGFLRFSLGKAFKKLSRLDEFSADAVAGALVSDNRVSARAIALLTVGPQLMSYLNFNSLWQQAQEVVADKNSQKAERRLTHPLLLRRLSRFIS